MHLVARFAQNPARLITQLFKYGPDVILNIMSLRPEWILDASTRDAIVAFSILNKHSGAITQIEFFLGLHELRVYWPDYNLPDLFDTDNFEAECSLGNGIYCIDGWTISLARHGILARGQQVTARIGKEAFCALLKSDRATLSAWNAEHDSVGSPFESIHSFIRNNLVMVVPLWATCYRVKNKTKEFWVNCFLSLTSDPYMARSHDDMVLVAAFDRSQRRF